MAIGDLKDANITGELETTGVAFGTLIEKLGTAVAETSRKLDESSAKTATALAQTLVDVVAVQETVYDEDGNIEEAKAHTAPVPLVNLIDLPFYKWQEVRVQGTFVTEEITTASSSATLNAGMSSDISARGRLVGGAGVLLLGLGHKDSGSLQVGRADSSFDRSTGRVRILGRIRPRNVGVPKARQAVRGPHLALIPGQIQDLKDQDGKLVARTCAVLIEYRRRDGTAIAGKTIAVDTNGVAWTFTGAPQTDVDGRLFLELRREFLGDEPATAPVDVVVTARRGLVNTSVTASF